MCHRCAKLSREDEWKRPGLPDCRGRAHLCTRRWARWRSHGCGKPTWTWRQRKAAKARASQSSAPRGEWSARALLDPGSIPSSRRWIARAPPSSEDSGPADAGLSREIQSPLRSDPPHTPIYPARSQPSSPALPILPFRLSSQSRSTAHQPHSLTLFRG